MPNRRKLNLVLLTVACFTAMLISLTVHAQNDIDPEKYAKVKAGFLLNFLRYTEWPSDCFVDEDAPLVVTIVGRDRMTPEFERLIVDERVHDRRIELQVLEHPQVRTPMQPVQESEMREFCEKLRQSHVLFIATTEEDRFEPILDAVDEEDILTVSDIEEFGEAGGMLGLVVVERRVAFVANTREIADTKLQVSSRLLRLARIVETKKDRP